ncbi:MAG TPA: NTP transferase domain-containing protein [Thermoanaerobaculia bacterium]|nr:NTP transferase domain-containing protein [Thermoanaerobaculia bacterium]
MTTISAIVLAAGQATRFGECKQLVRLGEKTLLQHALDNLRASTVDEVVVVLGANADEIRRQVPFGEERVIFNPDYVNGMSTSIQAGLRAISSDAALIVLADQPFVTPRTIDRLIDEYRRTQASVVLPTYNGFRGNPVLVDRSLFAEMMNIRGDVGCRAIFGDHAESIVKVPVDDRGVVTDIDTSEDLSRVTPRLITLSSSSTAEAKRFGVSEVPMQCYSGGVLDVFIEPSLPAPQLVIIGHETIARALARIGRIMQFHVTVVDPLATRAGVPEADEVVNELAIPGGEGGRESGRETFIVVATHGRYDEEAVEQAARSDASYIALVASPKRAAVILQTLRERGVNVDKVKSPAGLDIGAQGAEEIALSIVAEVVQRRRAERHQAPAETGPASPGAEAVDPICNMTVVIAGARYTAEYEGRRYYFCGAHCQHVFEQSHVA